MMTPLQFRGVIFDLDGTLIDSLAHIAAACNHVLATHNHSPLPTRLYAKFAGGGNHVLLEQTLTHVNLATTPEAINSAVAQKRAYDDSADTALLRPFPGASDALQQLTDAKLPLAVLSNKAEHLVRAAVARVFPHTPFLAVHGARPDVALKPDGSPALAILHKHMPGVEPNQCAFVGDTPVDMRTARNAGMLPIGVSWGFRSSTELKEAGAHVVVDTMSQLADVILNRAK